MNNRYPEGHWYFDKAEKWQPAIEQLENWSFSVCGNLMEELKWGCPCYTFQQSNIVPDLADFMRYCALMLFFKGVLLADPDNIHDLAD